MRASTAYADAAAASAASAAGAAATAAAKVYTDAQPMAGTTMRADIPSGGGPVVLVNDTGGVGYVPTTPKTQYYFRISVLVASEANPGTAGLGETFEIRVLAHQLAAGNLVVAQTSAVLNQLNAAGYNVTFTFTGSANGLVITVTFNPQGFTVRVIAAVEVLSVLGTV